MPTFTHGSTINGTTYTGDTVTVGPFDLSEVDPDNLVRSSASPHHKNVDTIFCAGPILARLEEPCVVDTRDFFDSGYTDTVELSFPYTDNELTLSINLFSAPYSSEYERIEGRLISDIKLWNEVLKQTTIEGLKPAAVGEVREEALVEDLPDWVRVVSADVNTVNGVEHTVIAGFDGPGWVIRITAHGPDDINAYARGVIADLLSTLVVDGDLVGHRDDGTQDAILGKMCELDFAPIPKFGVKDSSSAEEYAM